MRSRVCAVFTLGERLEWTYSDSKNASENSDGIERSGMCEVEREKKPTFHGQQLLHSPWNIKLPRIPPINHTKLRMDLRVLHAWRNTTISNLNGEVDSTNVSQSRLLS